MNNRRLQLIFIIIFSFVNVGLYVLAVDQEKRGEILSATYWNTPDGQRYWGAAINVAERGEFTIRTAGPTIRYRYNEKERPNPDLPLSEAARLPRQSRTVSEEPLARAGPLPALLFSIPMRLVGFDRAPAFIVSFQCALLFALSLLARSLAVPFRCNGNLLQGLLMFNPNLIGLAHHAQSELIFVFLFTAILWFCSRILTTSKPVARIEIILLGLCIGLLPLARPLGLYLIVALPILLLISLWIQGRSFRVRYLNFPKLVFVSLIAGLVMLPWAVRNYAVFGDFTLTQSEGIMMQWHYVSMKNYLGERDGKDKLADVISREDSEKLNECNSVRGPKCKQFAAATYLRAIFIRPPGDLVYALSSSWAKLFFSGGATQIANYVGVDRLNAHNFLYGKKNWYHSFLNLMKDIFRDYHIFSVLFLAFFLFATIARGLGIIGLVAVRGRQLWSLTGFYALLTAIFLLMYLFVGISRFRAPLEPILMLYTAFGISFLTGVRRSTQRMAR